MRVIDFNGDEESLPLSLEILKRHCKENWQCEVTKADPEGVEPFVSWLKELDDILHEHNIPTGELVVALATGCATSNGHAFVHEGKAIAWISTSHYPTPASIRVFVTHEVVHALHYFRVPEYGFANSQEKSHTGRQLITEGMATLITKMLLSCSDGDALWSGYLGEDEIDSLLHRYKDGAASTAKKVLDAWDKDSEGLFLASDDGDIDQYRSGYYLGLRILEDIKNDKGLNAIELLSLSRTELDSLTRHELVKMLDS